MPGNVLPSASQRRTQPGAVYRPRRPETTVLHQTVREHLETFLVRARDDERPVPRFVEREFRAFLDCGVLACGFVRVHCDECGRDRLVAFSCKGRGFCPSCGGRRMADTAAHLVEAVLPRVPVRQWVLTLPFALRYRLAFDAELTAAVLGLFVRALFASLRHRARRRGWRSPSRCGAVTFVQRFGDALNLNVHFHTLVLDGVYASASPGGERFVPLPPPETSDVEGVARRVARGLARLLERRGLGPEADPLLADPMPAEDPFLAVLSSASVLGRVATGKRAGRRILRFGDEVGTEEAENPAGPPLDSFGRALPWAELIRRVFAVDVLECPRCGGRMRILAAIQTPEAIRAILDHLGLPSRAPPLAPARPLPRSEPETTPEPPED